jgi:hypothetical protein
MTHADTIRACIQSLRDMHRLDLSTIEIEYLGDTIERLFNVKQLAEIRRDINSA